MSLFDELGNQKYLDPSERKTFEHFAKLQDNRELRTFALTLLYTGCRVSECLALVPASINCTDHKITFKTLKQRGKILHRQVPVPDWLTDDLNLVHEVRANSASRSRIWKFDRTTAWRKIGEIMAAANITGIKASPKGLRHSFGIACVDAGVQLQMISRWMGHASLDTTVIYTTASGQVERNVISRIWT